jgi:hypothetical protein
MGIYTKKRDLVKSEKNFNTKENQHNRWEDRRHNMREAQLAVLLRGATKGTKREKWLWKSGDRSSCLERKNM